LRRHLSTFFHSAWRVKGIIPSTLHPTMVSSRVKAMSNDGLKHFIKCSCPRVLKLVLNPSLLISRKTLVLCRPPCAFSSSNQKQFFNIHLKHLKHHKYHHHNIICRSNGSSVGSTNTTHQSTRWQSSFRICESTFAYRHQHMQRHQ